MPIDPVLSEEERKYPDWWPTKVTEMPGWEMKERKRLFDGFIGQATALGWEGNTEMLWSAWKIVVWPFIQGTLGEE